MRDEARNHEAEVEAFRKATRDLAEQQRRMWIRMPDDQIKAGIAALDAVRRSQNPSEVGSLSLRSNFQARDLNRSPQDEDHELREKIADALAENDQCGVGPLSRQEYLDDAEAIMSIIRTYGGTQEPRRSPQGEDHEAGIDIAEDAYQRLVAAGFTPKTADGMLRAYLSRCPSPERCPICGVKMPCDVQDHDVDAHLDAGSSPQGEDHKAKCTGWISSETGESIPTSALGRRSDAVECMECSQDDEPQGEDHEVTPTEAQKKYVAQWQGEDHEAGIEAAWAAWLDARTFRGQRESLSEAIAVYLSRCPSPEHWSETALRDITRQRDEATTELRRLRQRPSPERNERVSQDHDPGRDD